MNARAFLRLGGTMKTLKKKRVPLEYLFTLNIQERFTAPRSNGPDWSGVHLGDAWVRLDGVKRVLQMSRTMPVRREGGGVPPPPLVLDKPKKKGKVR